MNTSEALDLSKENIQPLKQGRNAVKLGTALKAQTDAELQQKLMAEREEFEMLIRMYEGDDPLKPHYDYVHWIEQSFPKHGPESNLIQILENTLTTFKDDERYKQDLRYAELLIKYIDSQPNPIQIYQLVYNQGLCTMCAPFYIAWAEELDKVNDVKNADQIFELGIKIKAQPLELLQNAHLQFQLSVGRRMLGRQEVSNEKEEDFNRQALHKLQKRNVHSHRDPVGAPGQIKQQPGASHNSKNSAPFKIYQGDDSENFNYGESNGKVFPKESMVNKENQLKPGPWTQKGGKHRSRGAAVPTAHTPTFQVHEDEGANIENGHHKISSVPRALKPRKIDNFTCPLAVFEPPDPTKKPMYCKNKVYAGGREFQFEELRAALYNRRYEQLQALKIKEEVEIQKTNEELVVKDKLISNESLDVAADEKEPEIEEVEVNHPIEALPQEPPLEHQTTPLRDSLTASSQVEVKTASTSEQSVEEYKQTSFHPKSSEKEVGLYEGKLPPLEANTSLFHCQSFTVNTKEAMNVVQEMWNSSSPAQAFGKNRASRNYLSSPVGLDESGVFKVPLVPSVHTKTDISGTPVMASKPLVKSTPSFPIYSDDETTPLPTPSFPIFSEELPEVPPLNFPIYSDDETPTPAPPKPFQVYSDDVNAENVQTTNPKTNALPLNPFNDFSQPPTVSENIARQPIRDPATLKMLAFQSDSDDSSDDAPLPNRNKDDKNLILNPSLPPEIRVTLPTPKMDNNKLLGVSSLSQPPFHDEDGYEDMTCNTKAFDFVLPSSTPLIGHLKTTNGQPDKNVINGSYIAEDVKKCATKQELSMIFEASKERYSSSSGSSGSKTQGSVCTNANTSIQPCPTAAQAELMEKLAQISANETQELEKSFGLLNVSGPVDPFSTELITRFLFHIGYPHKHHLTGLHRFETDAPIIHCNSNLKLGNTKYYVIGELGKGNYARVLKATRDGAPVALKQQKPAWEWEWYIVQELHSRLPSNMMGGYLHMSNAYIYRNGSILESEWAQYGSILSVVNKLKIAGKGQDLHLSVLFSIQLVSIVEHLHKCEIIHGDIKPDNFVFCSVPSADLADPCLKLIDFGRSIDMTLFPKGTTFNTVVTTDGFQCNEMKDGRPWTYQTDLYGLAGSIFCVLFYDYMKVVKRHGKWQLSNKIPRYMAPDLWQEIFNSLLNVESCDNLPDLSAMREKLQLRHQATDTNTINLSINRLSNVLMNK